MWCSEPLPLHACQQAALPVDMFADGRPQYLWAPLQRPAAGPDAGATRKSSSSAAAAGAASAAAQVQAGEVRLRAHWVADRDGEEGGGNAPPGGGAQSLCIEVALRGVGLSLVEAPVLRLPREVRTHCSWPDLALRPYPHPSVMQRHPRMSMMAV
jgi:hypothetical protein